MKRKFHKTREVFKIKNHLYKIAPHITEELICWNCGKPSGTIMSSMRWKVFLDYYASRICWIERRTADKVGPCNILLHWYLNLCTKRSAFVAQARIY